MAAHAHQKFFRDLLVRSDISQTDKNELNEFFDALLPDQADFFFVLLSEDTSWLPKILANYRAKCAAFRERDDRMLDAILKTELAELDASS